MSIDPISLTVALSALIVGLWNHVKSSKCGKSCCEIQMNTPHHTTPPIRLVTKSEPIDIPSRLPNGQKRIFYKYIY